METFATTITSKGQATIPKVIRKYLGLHGGDKVNFIFDPESKTPIQITQAPAKIHEDILMMAQNFAPEWRSPEDCKAFDHFESEPRGGNAFWWHGGR